MMIFPGGLAIWGGKSLPFSAVFSIAANSYSAVAPKANAEKQVCAERDILSMSCPQCGQSGSNLALSQRTVFRGSLQKIRKSSGRPHETWEVSGRIYLQPIPGP